MITKIDLKENFHKETGMTADTHGSQFTKWIEDSYLELLNEIKESEEDLKKWANATIDEQLAEIYGERSINLTVPEDFDIEGFKEDWTNFKPVNLVDGE